jgi:hypothetical protein
LVCACLASSTACAPYSVHAPGYVPSNDRETAALRTSEISLAAIDRINNAIPVPEQISAEKRAGRALIGALGGPLGAAIAYNGVINAGDLLICDSCTYYLDEPPATLLQRVVSQALIRRGVRIVSASEQAVEFALLRFEFTLGRGTFTVPVQWVIILQGTRKHRNGSVSSVTAVASGTNRSMTFTPSQLGSMAAKALSNAVDQILDSPLLKADLPT